MADLLLAKSHDFFISSQDESFAKITRNDDTQSVLI
jgi:hypothetical protein